MSKEILLHGGEVTVVDDDVFEWAKERKWYAVGKRRRYAVTNSRIEGKRKSLYLHKMVLEHSAEMQVDHINGDSLDNRRENLRACTHSENMCNSRKPRRRNGTSSQYKGVMWSKNEHKWLTIICIGGRQKRIGGFANELDAATAYNDAALKYFGEFAHLNDVGGKAQTA